MCGIAGSFGMTCSGDSFESVFRALAHRGPDASGVFRDQWLRLGMNRLAFRGANVDLPVREIEAISAYNGQVYGHIGANGSYVTVQEGLANEIKTAASLLDADGMYAYSRYSPRDCRLTLGTDRHFIKPLFVRQLQKEVVFASEMAPLLRLGCPSTIHRDALAELFAYGWYLSDQTCASDVSLVCKNDVTIGLSGIQRWPKRATLGTWSGVADDKDIRSAIEGSVRRSTLGRGPLGLALSGGLDSSILAWELNALGVENLVCVTVQTQDGGDDLASLAELGLPNPGSWRTWEHVVVRVEDESFLRSFESSSLAFGQPTTMSSLPLYQQLADAASAHGVRAMILGEGVDEYFGGYGSYAKVASLSRALDYYRYPARRRLVATLFGEPALQAAEARFEDQYEGCRDLRTIEAQLRLTRLLLRSDVCLMSRSIEGRVPFLHNDIPAMAMSIPWNEVTSGLGKAPLRRAYGADLGERARRAKVRFKSSDAMLLRCLELDELESRIVAQCGRFFGRNRVVNALKELRTVDGFDADILCLMMSLTFLLENELLHGDS